MQDIRTIGEGDRALGHHLLPAAIERMTALLAQDAAMETLDDLAAQYLPGTTPAMEHPDSGDLAARMIAPTLWNSETWPAESTTNDGMGAAVHRALQIAAVFVRSTDPQRWSPNAVAAGKLLEAAALAAQGILEAECEEAPIAPGEAEKERIARICDEMTPEMRRIATAALAEHPEKKGAREAA